MVSGSFGKDFKMAVRCMRAGFLVVLIAALVLCASLLLSAPSEQKRVSIYSTAANYTLSVLDRDHSDYVSLFEVLEPLGTVTANTDGSRWKLRMVFTHEPIVPPGSQTLTFDNKTIPSATFQEDNGAVEITVNGSVPLFASFSNDGRTITVTAAPQTAAEVAARTPQPQLNLPAITSPVQAGTYTPAVSSGAPTYFAVVDASHGGEERGAALSDQLSEKDITLAFARKLRQELESRGVSTLVLRDGDTTLSLDHRANLANAAHPAIYICVHAASQGTGVRLYGSMLPAGGENRGSFLDWDTAQSGFASASQIVEASLIAELQKKQISVRTLIAPLRPLNNITAAAVAVEIAPPEAGISELNSPGYQQLITETIATGIVAAREKMEAPR